MKTYEKLMQVGRGYYLTLRKCLAWILIVTMFAGNGGFTSLADDFWDDEFELINDLDGEDTNQSYFSRLRQGMFGSTRKASGSDWASHSNATASDATYSFTLNQEISSFTPGDVATWSDASVVTYIAAPSIAITDKDKYRLRALEVEIPDGGSYKDESGEEPFVAEEGDAGKIYRVLYGMEVRIDSTWTVILDTLKEFEFQIEGKADYIIKAIDTELYIGYPYNMAEEATYTTDIALSDEEKSRLRVKLKTLEAPDGSVIYNAETDLIKPAEITPTYEDWNSAYTAVYIMERSLSDENWVEIEGTEVEIKFPVKEVDYTVTIEGVDSRTVVAGQEIPIMGKHVHIVTNPSAQGGVLFQVVVDGLETPADGSYTWNETDTEFTTDESKDVGKIYKVIYKAQKSTDGGMSWTDVPDVKAEEIINIVGNRYEDEIISDDVKVSNLKITYTDGTEPFDREERSGNDTGLKNSIVRTHDGITYHLKFDTQSQSGISYKHGRLYFEAELPLKRSEATFDTGAMGIMDVTPGYEWQLEEDPDTGHQTLKFYYEMNETMDDTKNSIPAFPGSGTINVYVNVHNMKNGEKIIPTFRSSVVWEEDAEGEKVTHTSGTFDVVQERVAAPITVSAAPSYNVVLQHVNDQYVGAYAAFDFDSGIEGAPDRDKGTVYGKMQAFTLGLQLYNEDVNKGLKGIEFPDPTKPITFDVNLPKATFVPDDPLTHAPVTVDAPLVWDAGSKNNTPLEYLFEREIETYAMSGAVGTSPISADYPASKNFEESPKTGSVEVWNGGTWEVEKKDANTVSFTVKDFIINPFWFPNANEGGDASRTEYFNPAIGVKNIGYFSVGAIFLVYPLGGSTDSTDNEYYPNEYGFSGGISATITENNFKATSLSQVQVTNEDQVVKTDDSYDVTITAKGRGSYSSRIFYTDRLSGAGGYGMDGVFFGQDYMNGTDAQLVGGDVYIGNGGVCGISGDLSQRGFAWNLLAKFDDTVIEPKEKDEQIEEYRDTNHVYKVNWLYAAKEDGSGWNDDDEMKEADEEDLVYYATLAELKADGKTCVGMLTELRLDTAARNSYYEQQVFTTLKARVKETAQPGKTAMLVQSANVWREESFKAVEAAYGGFPSRLDSSLYGQEIESIGGTDTTPDIKDHKFISYNKTYYDDQGYHAADSVGYPENGDSLYVVPYTSEIEKHVAQKNAAGGEKNNYDMSQQETIADYVMYPSFKFDADTSSSTDNTTTVTIRDTIPGGLTYIAGSARYGGDYANPSKAPSDPVSNGAEFEPGTYTVDDEGNLTFVNDVDAIEYETDLTGNLTGNVILTWNLEGIHLDGRNLKHVFYRAQIDMETREGTQLVNTATIHTTEDRRTYKGANGNLSTATIQINSPALLTVRKVADSIFNEPNQAFSYRLRWSNTSTSTYNDQLFMDFMPYNGDAGGSDFDGTYEVTGIQVTNPAEKAAENYHFYYTEDKATIQNGKTHSTEEFAYEHFAAGDDNVTSGGVTWIKGNIADDGSVTDIAKMPTAWMLVGNLPSGKSLHVTLTMKPTDNLPLNSYVNSASSGEANVTATTHIIQRRIEGIVWEDSNYNGQRDSHEKRLAGVQTAL